MLARPAGFGSLTTRGTQLVVAKKGMIPALITLLQTDKVLQTRIAQLIHVLTRQGPAAVRCVPCPRVPWERARCPDVDPRCAYAESLYMGA